MMARDVVRDVHCALLALSACRGALGMGGLEGPPISKVRLSGRGPR
jgi:hypothetical protein